MIVIILAVGSLAALITLVTWRLSRYRVDDPRQLETWLDSFSPATYHPMLRLSGGDDTGFITAHRGQEEALRYRRLQRQMLREYLRGLSRDCHRLHLLAFQKASGTDSALAPIEDRLEFVFAVWNIELRLLLDQWRPCVLNLQPLLANVDELTARAREGARRRHSYRM